MIAKYFATHGFAAIYSYAGRTGAPTAQPLPTRVGGFGGADGLATWLKAEGITHIVDATHPFAAKMSRNAIAAAAATGLPLCGYERVPWEAGEGDDWTHVADIAEAVAALPKEPCRIFLAIGRQTLSAFAVKPQHKYLLRLVDPPKGRPPLPDAEIVVARGPFTEAGDLKLLTLRRVNLIVTKNSGGDGARAKLDAARALRIPVIMIDRPVLPPRRIARNLADVMAFLGHPDDLGV